MNCCWRNRWRLLEKKLSGQSCSGLITLWSIPEARVAHARLMESKPAPAVCRPPARDSDSAGCVSFWKTRRGRASASGTGSNNCARGVQPACQGLRFGRLRILLENTAGQGECNGHRFEHLRAIMKRCPNLPLGVCVDTAHSFTAGYDIREAEGLEAPIEIIRRTVGLRNVRAVHFNDSLATYNSRVDRHWHIGEGHIGGEALRRFARHPKLAHAAFILETPYDDPRADLKNLEMLRSFVDAHN